MKKTLESRVSVFMKWVGVIAALLSFGTAVVQVVRSEGELREHSRVVKEQYATGRAGSRTATDP